jgi:hypothetical protein
MSIGLIVVILLVIFLLGGFTAGSAAATAMAMATAAWASLGVILIQPRDPAAARNELGRDMSGNRAHSVAPQTWRHGVALSQRRP